MPHYSPEIASGNKYMSSLLMIILHVWTANLNVHLLYNSVGQLSCVVRNAKNHGVYCDRIQKLGLALILSWHRYTHVLLFPICSSVSRCKEHGYFCLYTVYAYWALLDISSSWTKTKPNCQYKKINSYLAENRQSLLLRLTGECCQRNNPCFIMRTIRYMQIRVGRI